MPFEVVKYLRREILPRGGKLDVEALYWFCLRRNAEYFSDFNRVKSDFGTAQFLVNINQQVSSSGPLIRKRHVTWITSEILDSAIGPGAWSEEFRHSANQAMEWFLETWGIAPHDPGAGFVPIPKILFTPLATRESERSVLGADRYQRALIIYAWREYGLVGKGRILHSASKPGAKLAGFMAKSSWTGSERNKMTALRYLNHGSAGGAKGRGAQSDLDSLLSKELKKAVELLESPRETLLRSLLPKD